MSINFDKIVDLGEESGREEAAADFPFLPECHEYRMLYRFGRGRAQGLYKLRGKAARVFANNWAMGYQADCRFYERVYPNEVRQAREE